MSARSAILDRLRRVTLDARPLPELRQSLAMDGDITERFVEALLRMGGEIQRDSADLRSFVVRRYGAGAKVFVPRPDPGARFDPSWTTVAPSDVADLDLVIVRAAFAVAETGSVCLTEAELAVESLGYLPQHLMILLDPAQIVPDLHAAYDRPEWHRARYAVLQSGPSATADIEGVLIRGAQGVRSLTVALDA